MAKTLRIVRGFVVLTGVAIFACCFYGFSDAPWWFFLSTLALPAAWILFGLLLAFFLQRWMARAYGMVEPEPPIDTELPHQHDAERETICQMAKQDRRALAGLSLAAVLGGGFMVAAPSIWPPETAHPLGCHVMGALLLLAGYCGLAWVNVLVLDTGRRTYAARRGLRPFHRRRQGSFDDFSHIRLEYVPPDGDTPESWPIRLVWKDKRWPSKELTEDPCDRPGGTEIAADRAAERWAHRLGLPLQDETGRFRCGSAGATPAGRASEVLQAQGPPPLGDQDWLGSLPSLPPRAGMWQRVRGGAVEVTARTDFAVALVIGIVLLGVAAGATFVSYEPAQLSPVGLRVVHTGLFWLSPLLLMAWWFLGDCRLTFDRQRLVYRLRLLGLTVHRCYLPWVDIEAINARSDRILLRLRGRSKPTKLGSSLRTRQRTWLIEALKQTPATTPATQ